MKPASVQTHGIALADENEDRTPAATEGVVEAKFLVPASAAPALIECARQYLAPDPHADAREGDGYSVYSLYFDDPHFGTYLGAGVEKPCKYRIRRYGERETLFLERKSKPEGRVRKHRTLIPAEELRYLLDPEPPDGWNGRWFHKQLRRRELHPVCSISYRRLARVGQIDGQYVRFTLDREVRCAPSSHVEMPGPLANAGKIDAIIAEVKFEHTMPLPFQTVIAQLGLEPRAISKYRRGVEACALCPIAAEAARPEQASWREHATH